MVQRIQTLLIDDLDGSEATATTKFGLDGNAYEIDLNDPHTEALRGVLMRYRNHARAVPNTSRFPSTRNATITRGAGKRPDTKEERAYLMAAGYPIKVQGRIPKELHAIWENRGNGMPLPSVAVVENGVTAPTTSAESNGTAPEVADKACGCCGGVAEMAPKDEHGVCCNEQHDVKAPAPKVTRARGKRGASPSDNAPAAVFQGPATPTTSTEQASAGQAAPEEPAASPVKRARKPRATTT
jgi:hypothetical protein